MGDEFSRVVLENTTNNEGCEIDFTTNGNDWYILAGGSSRSYFENKFSIVYISPS